MAYGDAEVFAPRIVDLVKNLGGSGVEDQVEVGKDQVHNYPVYTKVRSEDGFYGRLRRFLCERSSIRRLLNTLCSDCTADESTQH